MHLKTMSPFSQQFRLIYHWTAFRGEHVKYLLVTTQQLPQKPQQHSPVFRWQQGLALSIAQELSAIQVNIMLEPIIKDLNRIKIIF